MLPYHRIEVRSPHSWLEQSSTPMSRLSVATSYAHHLVRATPAESALLQSARATRSSGCREWRVERRTCCLVEPPGLSGGIQASRVREARRDRQRTKVRRSRLHEGLPTTRPVRLMCRIRPIEGRDAPRDPGRRSALSGLESNSVPCTTAYPAELRLMHVVLRQSTRPSISK